MSRVYSDGWFVAPAPFATRIGGLGDKGIRFAVGRDEIEVAEDQELLDFADFQLMDSMLLGQ